MGLDCVIRCDEMFQPMSNVISRLMPSVHGSEDDSASRGATFLRVNAASDGCNALDAFRCALSPSAPRSGKDSLENGRSMIGESSIPESKSQLDGKCMMVNRRGGDEQTPSIADDMPQNVGIDQHKMQQLKAHGAINKIRMKVNGTDRLIKHGPRGVLVKLVAEHAPKGVLERLHQGPQHEVQGV